MVREEFEDKLVDLVSSYLETGEDLEWNETDDMSIVPSFIYKGKHVDIEMSITKPFGI